MRSPLSGWLGGKSQLASRIIARIPAHRCYVEAFAGAAWVLFKRPESEVEVLNDLNRDVVTLYRVVQHHIEEFVRYFRWILVSRDEFDQMRRVDPEISLIKRLPVRLTRIAPLPRTASVIIIPLPGTTVGCV